MGVLVLLGMYVPIALIACSFLGVWAIKGSPLLASKMLGLAANDAISSYFFGVVPLFVFMGFVVSESGMGRDAFDVANAMFRRIKGGLGLGTIAANTIFAAITGISIASAAVFTKIAIPELVRHGYSQRFSLGVVAGSSVLGMLIPPSLLLILYGLLAEQSIGDLFLAGVGPGILLACLFGILTIVLAYLMPSEIGGHVDAQTAKVTRKELFLQRFSTQCAYHFGAGRHLCRHIYTSRSWSNWFAWSSLNRTHEKKLIVFGSLESSSGNGIGNCSSLFLDHSCTNVL